MREYYNYDEWVDRVLADNREFSYRYLYDAYLMATGPSSKGMYYTLQIRTSPAGPTEYVLQNWRADYALILVSDQGRLDFAEYLLNRFCPQTRDMAAWHDQQHDWQRDDLDNWVDADGQPFDRTR